MLVIPDFAKETKGLDAIIAKWLKFDSMVDEINNIQISAPMIAGKSFASMLTMDITMKGKGRMNMPSYAFTKQKTEKLFPNIS